MAKFQDHRDINWPGAWLIQEKRLPGVPDIPYNRTLFIQQLTEEAPFEPEFVEDCQTLPDVFDRFKPKKEVQFEDEGGVPISEELQFKSLMDFGRDGIIAQSDLLQNIQQKQEMYAGFIKRLRSIKILHKLLADAEAKAAYLEAIQSFITELDEIDPEE
ncbi:MAG: hypothetical protein AAF135_15125 [Bacteroidota bacterium]